MSVQNIATGSPEVFLVGNPVPTLSSVRRQSLVIRFTSKYSDWSVDQPLQQAPEAARPGNTVFDALASAQSRNIPAF